MYERGRYDFLKIPLAFPPKWESGAHLEQYGCMVWVEDGTLLGIADGDSSEQDVYEISAPEDQAFLDVVNAKLGTSFRFEDFPGR